ncbi:butyrate kinase [Slackia equolifaciens]|uniref:Probable butyrate kinase n=1 Tax=Slackia equolifaciens TaxID=498718 RepID=A0A3N0B5Q7_9ACTN|nr:butyrate kinase [Slackia equolifaciens]RNL42154.1 butyrate kinase [Slackia equolifaciens]
MTTILTINPGSTSTKVGLFDNDTALFTEKVAHAADKLAFYEGLSEQLPYRRDCILEALGAHDVDLAKIDAFVGRGGGLLPVDGGTYAVNSTMLSHAMKAANGVIHPANLGSQLAHEFALFADPSHPRPAFVVNPPDTDELCDCARMTGIKGVYRHVHLHALNLKETAIRHAASLGRQYEECNFVVCHVGGGTSVSAHRKGKMVDGNDIVGGEGPMTPTRCGAMPVVEILDLIEEGRSVKEVRKMCMKTGGFTDLLGTSDAMAVQQRAELGDAEAKRAWDAMLYQVCKEIGAMACVLGGEVDGIVLGGGMVHSNELVDRIIANCGWIAPVTAYPGEFELEAMAAGALRVLKGEEVAKEYTGIPVWQGF